MGGSDFIHSLSKNCFHHSQVWSVCFVLQDFELETERLREEVKDCEGKAHRLLQAVMVSSSPAQPCMPNEACHAKLPCTSLDAIPPLANTKACTPFPTSLPLHMCLCWDWNLVEAVISSDRYTWGWPSIQGQQLRVEWKQSMIFCCYTMFDFWCAALKSLETIQNSMCSSVILHF